VVQYTPIYRIPYDDGPDPADAKAMSSRISQRVEAVLQGKADIPPAGKAYLTYGAAQSPYAVTVWGSSQNLQLEWNVGTDAPRAHLRLHVGAASGGAGAVFYDLMRNDGHGAALPAANWDAALAGVPAYRVAYQQRDIVVTGDTSSSRTIKHDIEPLDAAFPDAVGPVKFKYNHPDDADHLAPAERERVRYGFIAEDVPDACALLDSEGRPYDVDARSMVALLWAEVVRLRDRVAALEKGHGA
jgi:hypothetical protein